MIKYLFHTQWFGQYMAVAVSNSMHKGLFTLSICVCVCVDAKYGYNPD